MGPSILLPAQQRRQPVAVRVAADLDDRRRSVVDRSVAPIGEVRKTAARPILEVELELAAVQRDSKELLATTRSITDLCADESGIGAIIHPRRMQLGGFGLHLTGGWHTEHQYEVRPPIDDVVSAFSQRGHWGSDGTTRRFAPSGKTIGY